MITRFLFSTEACRELDLFWSSLTFTQILDPEVSRGCGFRCCHAHVHIDDYTRKGVQR